jgi:hypothetical protein
VRSTSARRQIGSAAIVADCRRAPCPPPRWSRSTRPARRLRAWLSEATAALQLKGLWSRAFGILEAILLHAMLASNLLNRWVWQETLPGRGLPPLRPRQVVGRVIAVPARVLRAVDGGLLLVPPARPYARALASRPLAGNSPSRCPGPNRAYRNSGG